MIKQVKFKTCWVIISIISLHIFLSSCATITGLLGTSTFFVQQPSIPSITDSSSVTKSPTTQEKQNSLTQSTTTLNLNQVLKISQLGNKAHLAFTAPESQTYTIITMGSGQIDIYPAEQVPTSSVSSFQIKQVSNAEESGTGKLPVPKPNQTSTDILGAGFETGLTPTIKSEVRQQFWGEEGKEYIGIVTNASDNFSVVVTTSPFVNPLKPPTSKLKDFFFFMKRSLKASYDSVF